MDTYLPSVIMKKSWALLWGIIPVIGILMGCLGVHMATRSADKTLFISLLCAHLFGLLIWAWQFVVPLLLAFVKMVFVNVFSF